MKLAYVLGHKYVFGPPLRTHFNPRFAQAKMSLSRAKNIFMPANINSIVIFYPEKIMVYNWFTLLMQFQWHFLSLLIYA